MTAAVLALLGIATGVALLGQGGVDEASWRISQAIIGIAAIAAFVPWRHRLRHSRLDPRAAALFAALAVYVTLQAIPLPANIVATLSPSRAALSAALDIVGPAPASITLSVDPSATVSQAMRWLTAAVVFLLARAAALRFDHGSWWPVVPVVVLAMIEAGIGIVQLVSGAPVQGTSGNRNHFAASLNLALPFALAAGASGAFVPALGAAALLAGAAIVSLSRMAFLVAMLCCGIAGWRLVRHRFPPVALALLAAGMIPAVFALAPGDLIERFSGNDDRLTLWSETVRLIRDYPLFGCGLGAYEPAFQYYKRVAPGRTADFAHNDFLQWFTELGFVGFALLAAGLFFLVRPAFRNHEGGWFATARIAALSGAALHSFTDYPLYIPAHLLLFAWVLGVSCRPHGGRTLQPADSGEAADSETLSFASFPAASTLRQP